MAPNGLTPRQGSRHSTLRRRATFAAPVVVIGLAGTWAATALGDDSPTSPAPTGDSRVIANPPPPASDSPLVISNPPPPVSSDDAETKVATNPPPPAVSAEEGESKVVVNPPPPATEPTQE